MAVCRNKVTVAHCKVTGYHLIPVIRGMGTVITFRENPCQPR
jgi:hypothetical protein